MGSSLTPTSFESASVLHSSNSTAFLSLNCSSWDSATAVSAGIGRHPAARLLLHRLLGESACSSALRLAARCPFGFGFGFGIVRVVALRGEMEPIGASVEKGTEGAKHKHNDT